MAHRRSRLLGETHGPAVTDLFERALSVTAEDVEIELRAEGWVSWVDFLLNPRRLRGSDFLMRWSQGVWSEERLVQAVNATVEYFALPYGPSGTAPHEDVRAFELYFERLERAGLGQLKRPDLLVFRKRDQRAVLQVVREAGGAKELPFISEEDPRIQELLRRAILAVECENSLWRAGQMPGYGAQLTPQRRLGGRTGLRKSAVVPTVILKEEDRAPLRRWQRANPTAIHIWHVFYDMAFGLALDRAEELIKTRTVEPTEQVFHAPSGATTKKTIYKIYYHYAYRLGEAGKEPTLVAEYIADKNGHILPYVRFEGGDLVLSSEALEVLGKVSPRGGKRG